jgi:hypothetical protein
VLDVVVPLLLFMASMYFALPILREAQCAALFAAR